MHIQSVNDRQFINEANSLISIYGDDAIIEAATKADAYRDAGNLVQFCRWRQVERAILMLQLEDIVGEIH